MIVDLNADTKPQRVLADIYGGPATATDLDNLRGLLDPSLRRLVSLALKGKHDPPQVA